MDLTNHISMKMRTLSLAFAILGVLIAPVAHAVTISYTTSLSGAAESPANASPGTGSAIVTYDSAAQTLRVEVTFSGLLGTTTAAHIHAATTVAGTGNAGVATQLPYFTGFPLGVTSGTYDHTFDLTDAASFNPAYVTGNGGTTASAEAALVAAMDDGKAYLNIHSTVVPGGEIRGFLNAPSVPDAGSTLALLGIATVATTGLRRRLKS